jgi:hypothetical protein
MVHTVMNRRRVESFAPAYEEWLPLITECVLGRRYSWADLALHVTQTQGREFTANALLQRGDKAARYGEFNGRCPASVLRDPERAGRRRRHRGVIGAQTRARNPRVCLHRL